MSKRKSKKPAPGRSLVDILQDINDAATEIWDKSRWNDTDDGVAIFNAADRIDQFIYEARVLLGLAK